MKTITWIISQDQGTSEIIALMQERYVGAVIDIRQTHNRDRHGYEAWEADFTDNGYAIFTGMVDMIGLMGPAADIDYNDHDQACALRQLQRLIYGNLGCVEPKLEPYEE